MARSTTAAPDAPAGTDDEARAAAVAQKAAERKTFGKYHGLDPWDDPALFVSEPGTGIVFDVRELAQVRPGVVRSPVTGRDFEIAPNVVARAHPSTGALSEPAFDGQSPAE